MRQGLTATPYDQYDNWTGDYIIFLPIIIMAIGSDIRIPVKTVTGPEKINRKGIIYTLPHDWVRQYFCVVCCSLLLVFLSLFFGPLCCQSSFDVLLLLITPFVSSEYPFEIFWLPLWYLLITHLLFSDYPFVILWLPICHLLITPLESSDCLFGIEGLLFNVNSSIFQLYDG